jgi:ribonucleotide monophosphatase NagD (HAD superfamily)
MHAAAQIIIFTDATGIQIQIVTNGPPSSLNVCARELYRSSMSVLLSEAATVVYLASKASFFKVSCAW